MQSRTGLRVLMLLLVLAGAVAAGREAGLFRPDGPESDIQLLIRRFKARFGISGPGARWTPEALALLSDAGPRVDEMLLERDSTLIRWPVDERLRIWIQQAAGVPGWTPGLTFGIYRAFEAWEATGIPLEVHYVSDPEAANVRIWWVERLPGTTIGETSASFDDLAGIRSAEIRIALRDERDDAVRPSKIDATLLHEVGHLLGLTHSADPGSVMLPRSAETRISASDADVLDILYRLPYGRVPARE